MNAEFQTIPRRDKKAFLCDQCKEIEENNRMGRSRDLFKKIRDTKETFHVKMGTIKDRNRMDLTEAEDIKKRRQKHKELYKKKDLNDPDNLYGMIIHLEPDILKCEIKWALGSININKAAAAAKSPQSCLTLCNSIDSSPLGSPVPGILQARTLEWVSISFSNA